MLSKQKVVRYAFSLFKPIYSINLEEKSQNFATKMLSSSLFVIHDSSRCGHDNITKLSGGQKIVGPLFDFFDTNVKSGGNNSNFVESAGQIDNNFASTMVIHNFEFADVAMLHHHFQKSNDNFAAGSEQHLSFATFFSIVDALERRSKGVH